MQSNAAQFWQLKIVPGMQQDNLVLNVKRMDLGGAAALTLDRILFPLLSSITLASGTTHAIQGSLMQDMQHRTWHLFEGSEVYYDPPQTQVSCCIEDKWAICMQNES